jgi:hypothetical protein
MCVRISIFFEDCHFINTPHQRTNHGGGRVTGKRRVINQFIKRNKREREGELGQLDPL